MADLVSVNTGDESLDAKNVVDLKSANTGNKSLYAKNVADLLSVNTGDERINAKNVADLLSVNTGDERIDAKNVRDLPFECTQNLNTDTWYDRSEVFIATTIFPFACNFVEFMNSLFP